MSFHEKEKKANFQRPLLEEFSKCYFFMHGTPIQKSPSVETGYIKRSRISEGAHLK